MKYLNFFVFLFIFILFQEQACANSIADTETYILKYRNNENIYVISEEEKDILFNNNITTYSKDGASSYQEIEYIEPNYEVILFNETDNINWNYTAINTQYTEECGCFGNDIRIGVIDSGIYIHEHFEGNVLPGYNFINNDREISDDIGHGTFVSSIIGSNLSSSYSTGISNKAKIIPLKCFAKNYSTKIDVIEKAIRSAVDDFDCQIINMSFGLSNNSITLKNAINYALSKNVIIVASVGNYGTDEEYYPANYEGVIGVGSINSELNHSGFSQFNKSVDVVAPGENIKAKSIDSFVLDDGTSFSAPHVSAAAAIALCIDTKLTPVKFLEELSQTSRDLGINGYDEYYGYGLLDIQALCQSLLEETEFFMSPITKIGNEIKITIFNNTDKDCYPALINAEYQNSRFVNAVINTIYLPENTKKDFKYNLCDDTFKMFLWGNMSNLKPLTVSRIYNN